MSASQDVTRRFDRSHARVPCPLLFQIGYAIGFNIGVTIMMGFGQASQDVTRRLDRSNIRVLLL